VPWSSLACLLAFVSVFGLYLQWKTRRKSPLKNLLFWTAFVVSVYCWVLLAGAEFGIVYGFAVGGLLAITVAVATADYNNIRADKQKLPKNLSVGRHVWLRNLAYALLAVPLAGYAATVSTTWVSALFLGNPTNHIVFVYLAVPVVWGALAFVACSYRNIFRGAALLGLFSVIPTIGLIWL